MSRTSSRGMKPDFSPLSKKHMNIRFQTLSIFNSDFVISRPLINIPVFPLLAFWSREPPTFRFAVIMQCGLCPSWNIFSEKFVRVIGDKLLYVCKKQAKIHNATTELLSYYEIA